MAGDTKIRIPIELPPGDVSGATDAIDKIDEVKVAAEEANQAVEAAGKKATDAFEKLEDSTKKGDEGFTKLFDQQRLQGIGQQLGVLAFEVGNFARSFAATEEGKAAISGLSEEMQVFGSTAASVASSVAQGYAQGGPVGAAIGGIASLIKTVGGEYFDSASRIATSEQELEEAITANAERIRLRKLDAEGKEIRDTFSSEADELERQAAALDRIKKIRDAQQGLEKAQDKLADTRAVANGTPQAAVDIGNVGQDLARQQEELAEKLEAKRQEVVAAGQKIFSASRALIAETERIGSQAADAGKYGEAFRAAVKNEDRLVEDLAALEVELNLQSEAFTAGAATKLEEQKGKLLGTLETKAGKLEAALQAEIQEAGGNASTAAKEALKDVQKIMEDGAVTPAEVGVLLAAAQRMQGSVEARDAKVAAALDKVAENGGVFTGTLEKAVRIIEQQGKKMDDLDRRLGEEERFVRDLNRRMSQ